MNAAKTHVYIQNKKLENHFFHLMWFSFSLSRRLNNIQADKMIVCGGNKGEMVEKEENVLEVCAGFVDGDGGSIRWPGTYNL